MNAEEITEVLSSSKTVAVVGLSDKRERPAYKTTKYLIAVGYKIIPINPRCEKVLGKKCYPDLVSVPEKIDIVDIFRRSEYVGPVVDDAIKAGAGCIWMQEGIVNEEAAEKARNAGIPVIMDRCMYKEHAARVKPEQ